MFNDTRILLLFIAYFYQLTVKNSSSCFIFINNLWVVNCASSYRGKKLQNASQIFMFHFLSKNSLSVLANYIFCIDIVNNLMRLSTLWCRGVYVVIKEINCMIIYHISRVYILSLHLNVKFRDNSGWKIKWLKIAETIYTHFQKVFFFSVLSVSCNSWNMFIRGK